MVLIEGLGELGNGRGHLYSGEKDSLLSLEGDVFRPLDETGQVAGGLNAVSHSEVAGTLLEERVDLLFDLFGTLFSLHSFGLHKAPLTIFVTVNNYKNNI